MPTINLSAEQPPSMPQVSPEKVVLQVGDVKLTAQQFDQIIQSLPPQFQSSARGLGRKQFADNLVKLLVLANEGRRRKLDEAPAYKVQSQFQNANLLAGAAYDALGKEANVTDAELRKYYEDHKSEYERVHARHILIRVQGAPLPVRPGQKELSDAEALAKAQDLRKKIAGGADFAGLAREESDDAQSGANGGDLGFFGHNQMVPPFEKAAFDMKPGDLSEPVKTPFGYHVIRVEAKEAKTFEDMKPEIEKKLRPEAAQKAIDELQKKTTVEYDQVFFGAPAAPATPAVPAPPK